jgi:class 3 adenylate cyclase
MSQTLHILVVDDEPDLEPLIRQRFRRQIKANIYEFRIAHDGQEALQRLEEHPEIDIVLTDINMPRMDGLTLLSRLPETGGLRKAVVVTAYGDMENIRTAMNRGAFDFLTKPIDLEDLEITIRKAQAIVDRERKAELARATFGRYLSDRVVATLLDHPDGMRLGGEKRTATVVMSDIRGFSMISERLKPEEVVEILNIYLGEMTEIIHSFDGTIDEFIGDGILTVFGAPIAHEDDALRAVGCAVAMQLGMDDVNAQLTERGFPKLEMGIGINTGEVVVGNIGSQMRAKYGVVGSHVNLTSRIESFTVGGQILVSGRTLEEAGGVLNVGRRMEVPMKGFAHPVPIFEIVGVGAPYNLYLPVGGSELITLESPVPITYAALDGKHVSDENRDGVLVKISDREAFLEIPDGLDELANIRLTLAGSILAMPEIDYVDVYAKVTEVTQEGVLVRFTAVPGEAAAALVKLVAEA